MGRALRREGKGSGFGPTWLMRDIMRHEMYVDASRARAELGWTPGGVREAVVASVRASYPP